MAWIELIPSIKGHQVRRYIPDEIQQFREIFHTESIINNQQFWFIISQIINVPYEDLPLTDNMCCYSESGVTVYRSNHDTAHALRKVAYLLSLFKLVEQTPVAKYIADLSVLESNLLCLLVFLERSGRTNEFASSYDDTIMKRSAEIFSYVAESSLGCPHDMVRYFKEAILLGKKVSQNHFFLPHHCNGAFFFDCVLTVHHLDLLRCRETTSVTSWIEKDIKYVLKRASKELISSITTSLISFAENALMNTGTRYNPNNGAILEDDSKRKIRCVLNPGEALSELGESTQRIFYEFPSEENQMRFPT